MMCVMENKRGRISVLCAKLVGRDFHVNKLITDTLIENGYEVVSQPNLNEYGNVVEDTIDIYRVSDSL